MASAMYRRRVAAVLLVELQQLLPATVQPTQGLVHAVELHRIDDAGQVAIGAFGGNGKGIQALGVVGLDRRGRRL